MEIKNIFLKHKKTLIIIGIILSLIVLNIYTLTLINAEEEPEEIIETKEEPDDKTNEKIIVDIKGEINAGGVYELEKDSRVNDLINKAGGTTKNADTSLINLAKKLEDEMIIIIYSKEEVKKLKDKNKEATKITEICPKENNACPTKEPETIVKEEKKETNTNSKMDDKISINKATIEELQTLPGIGESKAKAIIEYREKEPFKTIEDIKNVSGIGDSAFEKIKNHITI